MAATIRVTRDKARSKDRRRPYTVVVDDIPVGELRRGETKDFPLAAGSRRLRVSVDSEHSRDWQASLPGGGVVAFVCRSRGKSSDGHVDLFLADPRDVRAHALADADLPERDPTVRQRVVARDGRVLFVWAHRSGYLRSFDPGSNSTGGDEFLLELAIYILVMPVLCVVRWVRHRLLFKRGWSVGVVRKRRFLWPKKVRLERFRTEAEARARVPMMVSEVENRPGTSGRPSVSGK